MSLALQNSIKNNQEELKDYLREMKNWEKDIKEQEQKLLQKKDCPNEKLPPVRKHLTKDKSTVKDVSKVKKIERKTARISSYDYDAWDKFDVDKALESESEEDPNQTCKEGEKEAEQKDEGKCEENIPSLHQSKEERANKLKEEGNHCFSKGKYSDAIAKYTQGIGLNPTNQYLPANRAMAYIKLKKFKAAEKDCSRALQLDPKYIKAYLRRATALTHLSNNADAKRDYEMVLKLEPWNKDAMRELEKINRLTCDQETLPKSSPKNDLNINMKKLKMDPETQVLKNPQKETPVKGLADSTDSLPQPSKKPLLRIPVVEVDSREEMEALLKKPTPKPKKISTVSESRPKELAPIKKEPVKPELPRIPRTSHQFSQDWRKVAAFEDLAKSYLLKVPLSFYRETEFEVEQLVEIFTCLSANDVKAADAASIVAALTKSRGFYLNMAFLENEQKNALKKIISKIEDVESVKSEITALKEVC